MLDGPHNIYVTYKRRKGLIPCDISHCHKTLNRHSLLTFFIFLLTKYIQTYKQITSNQINECMFMALYCALTHMQKVPLWGLTNPPPPPPHTHTRPHPVSLSGHETWETGLALLCAYASRWSTWRILF